MYIIYQDKCNGEDGKRIYLRKARHTPQSARSREWRGVGGWQAGSSGGARAISVVLNLSDRTLYLNSYAVVVGAGNSGREWDYNSTTMSMNA